MGTLTWDAKGPDEKLDYTVDWATRDETRVPGVRTTQPSGGGRLVSGDVLTRSTPSLVVPAGIVIDDHLFSNTRSIIYLSGGTAPLIAQLHLRVVTRGPPSRQMDEMIFIQTLTSDLAVTAEDGTGVSGADSYATLAFIDDYWIKRAEDVLAPLWGRTSLAGRASAARSATTYIDARWGAVLNGVRRATGQTLEFPRDQAEDVTGRPLPALPLELQWATAELSGRALHGPLTSDVTAAAASSGGVTKRVKAGPVEVEFDTTGAATATVAETSYPIVEGLMQRLTNRSGAWRFV